MIESSCFTVVISGTKMVNIKTGGPKMINRVGKEKKICRANLLLDYLMGNFE